MRKVGVLSILFLVVLLDVAVIAEAQPLTKHSRIGFLNVGTPATSPARQEVFRQGLRDLGYLEGKNIVVEWRSAEGKAGRLPELAAELVRLNVEIIVTVGPTDTQVVKKATNMIPMRRTTILLPTGLSLALRDLVETSLACPHLPQRLAANNWSFSRRSALSSRTWQCSGPRPERATRKR